MKVKCDYCGKVFSKHGKPNKKRGNFCCAEHRHIALYDTYICVVCGKSFERLKSLTKGLKAQCCSLECAHIYNGNRFHLIAAGLNANRMTPEVRAKIRESRLNRGEGKTYTKTFGRHTHRLVAEEMLGRKLLPGEIVHHIDGNKRNNDPSNLEVMMKSEHSRRHGKERYEKYGQKLFTRLPRENG